MSTSNTFSKGINSDVLPKYQEEGTYRFALNAVLETEEGEMPSITNEKGNLECAIDFPTDKKIIGSALTDTDDVVLFMYDPAGNHEIGIHNPFSCKYVTSVTDPCLNFSDEHPINAIVKIREGCNRVVYFTDNYNPYRVIDLDDIDSYSEPATPGVLACPRLLYSKDFFKPCVFMYDGIGSSGIEDNAGGNLEIGVYYFAVRFLDSKLNPTPWTTITRGIAIADEPFKHTLNVGTINLYDGGSNIETSPHYVQKTDKSLLFNITGVNGLFDYYQVAVVKRTGDNGEITAVDVLKPNPWLNGSVRFQYNGDPNKIERTGSLEELLISPVQIEKVKAHAIKDGRLFLGNTSFTKRDYSTYQQYASKIKTEWVKTAVTNAINSGVRQGNYYHFNGSFMEDEIYPWGIVYVHTDGEISPVQHIPGRPANNFISVNAHNPYVGTAGAVTVGTAPWDTGIAVYGNVNSSLPDQSRWRYISTAYQYGNGTLEGLMGYHECTTETYPEVETCVDLPNGYWGIDWQGNVIQPGVTKIRHHRMPGPELRELAAAAENFRLGVRFSQVEYPSDDVIGHFFVYGDREFNKTIQAKGVLIPVTSDDTLDQRSLRLKVFTTPLTPNNYIFVSAINLLQDKIVNGDYFKTEKVLRDMNYELVGNASTIRKITTNAYPTDPNGPGNAASQTDHMFRYFTRYKNPSSAEIINDIRSNIYAYKSYEGAMKGTETYEPNGQTTITNNSVNNSYQWLNTLSGPAATITQAGNSSNMYFGAIKNWKNVFNDLYNITYKRTNNCISTNTSLFDQYVHYGGDTAVNRVHFLDFVYRQTGIPPGSVVFTTDSTWISFPSQDDSVNYEFRHGSSTEVKDTYFQYRNSANMDTNHDHFVKYLDRKRYIVSGDPYADGTWSIYPESYNYNESFSYLNGIETFYPVPFKYDFCNLCVENNPYRVYYSEVDNEETPADNSRIVYSNNYQDVSGLTGEITDLFINFDNMYATTLNSLYMVPVNPQTLQSDLSTIYLGTGTTLSIPAREMKNTGYGFGGQQYFKSRVSTEYGTFYVDTISKRPLMLESNLEDLSLGGMRSFWQENGNIMFEDQFMKLTGIPYNIKSTSSPIGVGYISTYDPRFKRLITHKRDFKILPEYERVFQYYPQETDDPGSAEIYDQGVLWFNGFNFYFVKSLEPVVHELVTFDDVDYFENYSFTLSYSMLTKKWASFHSYLPSYTYNNSKEYFSQPGDMYTQSLYKHNAGEYQTYYEKKFAHIIDMIMQQNPLESKLSSSVIYTSKVREYVETAKHWRDIPNTYSAFVGYNTNQTTGLQFLQVKNSFDSDASANVALTQLTDNQWRINNIRNLAINKNEPIWDSS